MHPPSFAIKGRCPGALQPMASGDGLIVRVRPPLGRLTAAQALALAQLADEYGNGQLELSSRANVQLRGVAPAQHPALLAALAKEGLLDPDARSERLRAIVVDPCYQAASALAPAAQALHQALCAAPDVDGLPPKFGWALAHCSPPAQAHAMAAMAAVSADVRLWLDEQGGAQRWWLQPDGCAQAIACPELDAALDCALRLARWCAHAAQARRAQGLHPGRMASLWAAQAHPQPDWALASGCHWTDSPVAPATTATAAPDPTPGAAPGLGWLLAAPLGRIAAGDFAALAQTLAQPNPAAGLRITPWRMVLAEGLTALPAGLDGWISAPQDSRLRVWACAGAPGCDQAIAPTQALALQLAPLLAPGARLHVSGCAKGCAHPQPADYTLRAQTDTQGTEFALVRCGTAQGTPTRIFDAAALQAAPQQLFTE